MDAPVVTIAGDSLPEPTPDVRLIHHTKDHLMVTAALHDSPWRLSQQGLQLLSRRTIMRTFPCLPRSAMLALFEVFMFLHIV